MAGPPSPRPAEPGWAGRVARHRAAGAALRGMDDRALLRWLSRPDLLRHGSAALRLPDGGPRVFVKLLPLADLELRPEHRGSTANYFRLPARYHYRLGSLGFGAWRELEIHRRANRWVLSGGCTRFPLLHGWRVLPLASRGRDDRYLPAIWGGDPAIGRRIEAAAAARSSAALVLERFPRSLDSLVGGRAPAGHGRPPGPAATEEALLAPLAFLEGRGVLHMDAHLGNYLAVRGRVLLGDHGLAMARSFRLDAEEEAFLERHANFDRCTAIAGHVRALVSRVRPGGDWRRALRGILSGTHAGGGPVPEAVRSHLARRGPLALAMGDFHRRLAADLGTPYPASRLQDLLDAGGEGGDGLN